MNKWAVSAFLTFVFTTVLINGCAPAVTPSPVLPTFTSSPIPSTFTPGSISTATIIPPTISPQVSAIEKIRTDLELPELPLAFVEKTGMINSPGGGLEVVIYQDSDGRKYSVNPETNQVVEIDARILLPKHGDAITQAFSMEVLKSRAMKYIKAAIPDFDNLQSSWQYEEGGKGDVYFFTWYGEMTSGSMNRPLIQFGFHKNGLLFAYYNTLLLNK
jgi:hypothetical protein